MILTFQHVTQQVRIKQIFKRSYIHDQFHSTVGLKVKSITVLVIITTHNQDTKERHLGFSEQFMGLVSSGSADSLHSAHLEPTQESETYQHQQRVRHQGPSCMNLSETTTTHHHELHHYHSFSSTSVSYFYKIHPFTP